MENQTWTEVKIEINAKDVDIAGDIAQMLVPYGIYIEDYSNLEAEALEIAHIDLIDEELLSKNRDLAYIHVYLAPQENPAEAVAFLTERYNSEKISHSIDLSSCAQEDWINNWKKYFKPMPVGEKLLIRPIWEDEFDDMGRKVLNLEPGLAFGTGTHETTRLCMEMLENYVKEGDSILDMGCGSGILSIAGLILGAKKAVGVDIDPLAVKTAIENADMNNVSDKFSGICGNLSDKVDGKFDVLVANIVADVIIMFSKDVDKFMHDNSVYIISGIIAEREEDVLSAIRDKFTIKERREENGWVAFCLVQEDN